MIRSTTSFIYVEISEPDIVEGDEEEDEDTSAGLSPLFSVDFSSKLWATGAAEALADP